VTVSWFGPQNHAGYGLSVAPQNQREGDGMRHASRCSGLLRVEATRDRVFRSDLNTGRGATAGGACGTIAEATSRTN
jgi:hypothetical protein